MSDRRARAATKTFWPFCRGPMPEPCPCTCLCTFCQRCSCTATACSRPARGLPYGARQAPQHSQLFATAVLRLPAVSAAPEQLLLLRDVRQLLPALKIPVCRWAWASCGPAPSWHCTAHWPGGAPAPASRSPTVSLLLSSPSAAGQVRPDPVWPEPLTHAHGLST